MNPNLQGRAIFHIYRSWRAQSGIGKHQFELLWWRCLLPFRFMVIYKWGW